MVLLTRSICRLASQSRPLATRSLFTASSSQASRARPSILSHGAAVLRNNHLGIRTLTGKREKVKVLLVLYDGKKHAEEVSFPFPPLSPMVSSQIADRWFN